MKKILILSITFLVAMFMVTGQSVAKKSTVLTVDDDGAQCAAEYTTIAGAVAVASDGDTIRLCSGEYDGVILSKSLHFVGVGQVEIVGGPLHGSGLVQGFRLTTGSNGSSFSNLEFTDSVDLAIINSADTSDVVVENNVFINQIQAISAWRANDWKITHNTITDLSTRCGGGIGILLGDYTGKTVAGNEVSHNNLYGTVFIDPDDCGGYNGSGIVLYADFRWGSAGAKEINNNYISHNTVSLVSDTPAVVDFAAFEMTDTRDDTTAIPYPVIFDNGVGFNDFRDTALQVVLTPTDLENHNDISRNLGENRGHGLHPSVLMP